MSDSTQESATTTTAGEKSSTSNKLLARGVLTLAFGLLGFGAAAGLNRGNMNDWVACETPQAQKAPCSPAKIQALQDEDSLLSIAVLLSTLLAAKGVMTLAPIANSKKRGAKSPASQP